MIHNSTNKHTGIKEAILSPHALVETQVLETMHSSVLYFISFLTIMKNWKDADDSHRNDSIANEDLRM